MCILNNFVLDLNLDLNGCTDEFRQIWKTSNVDTNNLLWNKAIFHINLYKQNTLRNGHWKCRYLSETYPRNRETNKRNCLIIIIAILRNDRLHKQSRNTSHLSLIKVHPYVSLMIFFFLLTQKWRNSKCF